MSQEHSPGHKDGRASAALRSMLTSRAGRAMHDWGLPLAHQLPFRRRRKHRGGLRQGTPAPHARAAGEHALGQPAGPARAFPPPLGANPSPEVKPTRTTITPAKEALHQSDGTSNYLPGLVWPRRPAGYPLGTLLPPGRTRLPLCDRARRHAPRPHLRRRVCVCHVAMGDPGDPLLLLLLSRQTQVAAKACAAITAYHLTLAGSSASATAIPGARHSR